MSRATPLLVEQPTKETCLITLNRPRKQNSLSLELLKSLRAAMEDIGRQTGLRALIVRGAGDFFCTGLELTEKHTDSTIEEFGEYLAAVLVKLHELPLVTIASVEGAALGAGAGLMSACDYIVAATDARFGYGEVRQGLIPSLVMTLLRRQIRERHARELLLFGECIAAQRAYEMGLVNQLAKPGTTLEQSQERAEKVLHGAPGAVAETKRMLNELAIRPFPDEAQIALRHHMEFSRSLELREGLAACHQQREPKWRVKKS